MKVGDETKEVCTALCWADGQEIIERDVRRLDIVSLSRQVDLLSFFLSFFLYCITTLLSGTLINGVD